MKRRVSSFFGDPKRLAKFLKQWRTIEEVAEEYKIGRETARYYLRAGYGFGTLERSTSHTTCPHCKKRVVIEKAEHLDVYRIKRK